jgi:hypothetical protein
MKSIIRGIDRVMRRRAGVFEFCEHPQCFFRMRVMTTDRELRVPDGIVPAGSTVLDLHTWNERLPTVPDGGFNFAWAADGARRTLYSFRAAAQYLRDHPELDDVVAVGGESVLFDGIMRRVGFEIRDLRDVRGRWLDFWERVHSWLLIWAFNEHSLPAYRFRDLVRREYWMRREAFLQRFPAPHESEEGREDA